MTSGAMQINRQRESSSSLTLRYLLLLERAYQMIKLV